MSEFGELLRHARDYRGVTLRDAERATRINRNHLAALEQEDFADLPPLIYARGIVRTYAEYLGMDPIAVLSLFEEIHGQQSGGFAVVSAVKPLHIPSHWAPNFAIIAFMVTMSAVILIWMFSAFYAPADAVPAVPTVAANPTEPGVGGQTSLASGTPSSGQTAQGGGVAMAPASASPAASGAIHTFSIEALSSVWVEASVDGQSELATTLDNGETKSFKGSHMQVSTGNASDVRILVDGVDQGPLGTTWNAARSYP